MTTKLDREVKLCCYKSEILFVVAIDWIIRQIPNNTKLSIKWVDDITLEDMDFADYTASTTAKAPTDKP